MTRQNPGGGDSSNRRWGRGQAHCGIKKSVRQELKRELGDLLKTELDEIEQTIKLGTKPSRARGTTAQAAADDDSENGKFILDSATNPSFLKTTAAAVRPLTVRANIKTAYGSMHVKQGYRARIQLQTSQTIDMHAFVRPDSHKNLLSVRDVICSQGPIVFTKDCAYAFPQRLFTLLHLKKVATFTDGAYREKGQLATTPDSLEHSITEICDKKYLSLLRRSRIVV